MVPSCISRSPSRRGRICMAVRSQGRCMKREMRSVAVCVPFSCAIISRSSFARVFSSALARAAVREEASASAESFSTGNAAPATPKSWRWAAQKRCSATKGQGTEGTPALSTAPVHSVHAQCAANAQCDSRYWIGTLRSTTRTLEGRSAFAPSLCPVPVTTPQMRFFCCSRGTFRGVAEKPCHSETRSTRMPARRAASKPSAANPSSSALAMLPKEMRTGGGPAARNRESSSVGVQPASTGGTQKPARCTQRPQSAGLPRISGENACRMGKSWWWRKARLRQPSSMRCTPTRFWCHSHTVLRRAIH
mmetsp:Transcript_67524/g.140739  ORF Transcript_67524/g.140739 Transcript_67524/m.140739 type:complete len:306 (-) Transcript_67524:720-1637(-)